MSLEFIGEAKAHIPCKNGAKGQYIRIGAAFKDTNDGRLVFKFDAMPLVGIGWEGWVNVYPKEEATEPAGRSRKVPPRAPHEDFEDDIPF